MNGSAVSGHSNDLTAFHAHHYICVLLMQLLALPFWLSALLFVKDKTHNST